MIINSGADQSGAGKWLDWQNTADEPVLFPGIATRDTLLPNVPIDCNIRSPFSLEKTRISPHESTHATHGQWYADAKTPAIWASLPV